MGNAALFSNLLLRNKNYRKLITLSKIKLNGFKICIFGLLKNQ